MIQLNLLPDIKKEFIKAQKTKNVVISAAILTTIVALGIVVLLFLYVNIVQRLQLAAADTDIKTRTAQLKKVKDINKYLTIQNQLKSLPQLHEAKPLYSRLLGFLGTLNPGAPNSVSLSNLQVQNEVKTISFSGTAPTFEAFNVFVDTLKHANFNYKSAPTETNVQTAQLFKSVTVDSSNLTRSGGNQSLVVFTVRAEYKEEAFSTKSYDVTVAIPSIKTTDSVNNSPKPTQLFNGASPSGGAN